VDIAVGHGSGAHGNDAMSQCEHHELADADRVRVARGTFVLASGVRCPNEAEFLTCDDEKMCVAHKCRCAQPLALFAPGTAEEMTCGDRPERDFADAAEEIRQALVAEDVEVDSSAWLHEMRGDPS
jgi:hypothetical protein